MSREWYAFNRKTFLLTKCFHFKPWHKRGSDALRITWQFSAVSRAKIVATFGEYIKSDCQIVIAFLARVTRFIGVQSR